VFRDPAVYATTGEWLTHHGSLPIHVHAEVFGGVNGVSFASAAFDPVTTPGFVQSQFSNLLRGLLAVGGWLGGDAVLLRVNPLLAGAALLGFHGVARKDVGRAWALVPVAVLGVSAPCSTSAATPKRAGHDAVSARRARVAAGGAAARPRAEQRGGLGHGLPPPSGRRGGQDRRHDYVHSVDNSPIAYNLRHLDGDICPWPLVHWSGGPDLVGILALATAILGAVAAWVVARPDPAPREPRLDSPAHAETPVPSS
jgi:hypothetical protein